MSIESPRVIVLGGSIIHGVGYDGDPFGTLLAQRLNASALQHLTGSGQSCQEVLAAHTPAIETFGADLAVVMVGGTDSLMRPGHRVQSLIERYAPASWHGVAGLEPRARFSSNRRRRLRQRVESRIKVIVKRVLFTVLGGGRPRVEFEQLSGELTALLKLVSEHSGVVVLVGLPDIDPVLFPGSSTSFNRTNAFLEQLARRTPNCRFVRLAGELVHDEHFLADHLHLSGRGHDRVAELVTALVTERIAA